MYKLLYTCQPSPFAIALDSRTFSSSFDIIATPFERDTVSIFFEHDTVSIFF